MAGEKRHITRNRISYSCQKCRQRKVKCDKVHPICGACQKTNEECVYASSENETSHNDDLQTTQLQHGTKRKQTPTQSQEDSDKRHEATRTDFEAQLTQLSSLLGQLSHIAGIKPDQLIKSPAPDISETANVLTPESQQSYTDSHAQPANVVQHSQHGTSPSSVGGVNSGTLNLDSISAQLERLTSLLRVKQISASGQDVRQPAATQHNKVASTQATFEQKLDNVLFVPNEKQHNAMFRSWLYSVYPILPVVDPTVALMHYRTFRFWWKHGLEKGTPNPVEEYVPLVYAIYYAGMVSLSARGIRKWFPGRTRQSILGTARQQFIKSLQAPTRFLTNPPVLAARVMMCYLSSQDNNDIGLASTVAPLVRTAYSCNLHRDRPNETLDKQVAEVRRRLWWETVNLDTFEATASSMPPSINHHYCDVPMFGEIKDCKLGTPEASQHESTLRDGRLPDVADDPSSNKRTSMISVIFLVMRARTAIAANARRLLNINLAAKPKTKEDMTEIRKTLGALDREIKAMIDRIPTKGIPEQDFTPKGSKAGQSLAFDYGNAYGEDLMSDEIGAICGSFNHFEDLEMSLVLLSRHCLVAFHKWARIYLSMHIDQAHCYSFAPFLSNTKRKLWTTARQCALRNAHSCLRKFNALASDIELERFRWTWPGMFQPVHACIIILLDLYERPTSREAPRSRELFDTMLALASPEHGIVGGEDGLTDIRPLQESGNEAFGMLMQLRTKSWLKAGLDPAVLWTEQDQIDVGIAKPATDGERFARSMREDKVLDTPYRGNTEKSPMSDINAVLQERAKEVYHPAQIDVPEDHVCQPRASLEHRKYTEPEGQQAQNGPRLLRARTSQQSVPFQSDTHKIVRKESGYVYQFKMPSEVFDIDLLIEKIKSMRKSKEDGQVEYLYQQIATTNNDLTNFLSQKFPDASASPLSANGDHSQQQQPASNDLGIYNPVSGTASWQADDNEGDTAAHISHRVQPTGNATIPTSNPPSSQPRPDLSLPATSLTARNPPITTTSTPPTYDPTSTFPSTSNNNSTTAIETTTPTTNTNTIDMDFDWAKWDEIFGGIMDGHDQDGDPINFVEHGDDGKSGLEGRSYWTWAPDDYADAGDVRMDG